MNQTQSVLGIKITKQETVEVEDILIKESPLQISINKTPFTTTLRTPGNDLFLVRGLLFNEDIYSGKSEYFNYYSTCDQGVDTFHIEIDGISIENRRQLVSVSSCGLCGVESFKYPKIKPIESSLKLDPIKIIEAFNTLAKKQILFNATGGSHGCALFTEMFELLSIHEDIGRHNATDKVIGEALEKNVLPKAKILLVSGRISYEIVHKCFISNIPILAAVSSPSALAVEMAQQMGITVLGFSRQDRITCYSNQNRILQP